MKREDLIGEAMEGIRIGNGVNWAQESEVAKCAFLYAIANILLATEMRHTVGIAETIRSYEGGVSGE